MQARTRNERFLITQVKTLLLVEFRKQKLLPKIFGSLLKLMHLLCTYFVMRHISPIPSISRKALTY
jgi:hypothetical protein